MGKSDYVPQHYRILILLCSKCLAVLQGHTSLVGQLQMRDDILVTGGSDGSVRVWSLATYQAIHRLAAHDNSVTSLQFDNTRIVSGGSDGRVKVWDLKTGVPVRELSSPAEAVWRVVFEEEKAVIMASRGGRTIMEVSLPRTTHIRMVY
jgi:F-box and WD-40 domain protein CDC4